MSTENLLKRKNDEETISDDSSSTIKRVALDADAVDEDTSGDIDVDVEGNGQSSPSSNIEESAKISSHKVHVQQTHENGDPSYTYFRMLCDVKEAALIVGKGGEMINHIKEVSETRINVSENIRGITERVVHVRGSAENVAKAFGLITRAIVDEEENVASGPESQPFDLKLLIPHQIMGYVIGKAGSKLREIEEKSAAKLTTSPNSMPLSTDRCLSITGVADSIHIATYYTAQTILENKPSLKGPHVFYNPGTAQHAAQQIPGLPGHPFLFNRMSFPGMPPQLAPGHFGAYGFSPPQHHNRQFNSRGNNNGRYRNQHSNHLYQQNSPPSPQPSQLHPPPYELSLSNSMISGSPNITVPQNGHLAQDIYIPNEYVGNIIGKNGKSIKKIMESSGSRITIGDPDPTSVQRRVTISGSNAGNQAAVFLINNKIEMDMRSNEQKALQQKEQNKSKSKDEGDGEEIVQDDA